MGVLGRLNHYYHRTLVEHREAFEKQRRTNTQQFIRPWIILVNILEENSKYLMSCIQNNRYSNDFWRMAITIPAQVPSTIKWHEQFDSFFSLSLPSWIRTYFIYCKYFFMFVHKISSYDLLMCAVSCIRLLSLLLKWERTMGSMQNGNLGTEYSRVRKVK